MQETRTIEQSSIQKGLNVASQSTGQSNSFDICSSKLLKNIKASIGANYGQDISRGIKSRPKSGRVGLRSRSGRPPQLFDKSGSGSGSGMPPRLFEISRQLGINWG